MRWLSLLCAVCLFLGWTTTSAEVFQKPITITWHGESHFEFGTKLGSALSEQISKRYDNWPLLRRLVDWYNNDPAASAILDGFLTTHVRLFPDYMDELYGIAHGAGKSEILVFMANLSEELSYYVEDWPATASRPDHCSDYLVHTPDVCLGGHNEDSGVETLNNTALVKASFEDGLVFDAYVYAGDLPTSAFGVNGFGCGFSLNYVKPTQHIDYGLGRNFISRSLLESVDFDDLVARATLKGQAAGRSVQVFDFNAKRLANIETAGDFSVVSEVAVGGKPLFHANEYLHLNISQVPDVNSQHRDKTAASLPAPTDKSSVAQVLGSTIDPFGPPNYPIYQSGGDSNLWTMATVFFDLKACTVELVMGNPTRSISLETWQVVACRAEMEE